MTPCARRLDAVEPVLIGRAKRIGPHALARRAEKQQPVKRRRHSPRGQEPRLKTLFEERVRIWIVIETVDLIPPGPAIELLRFGQRTIRIQTEDLYAELTGGSLGSQHKPLCEPQATG